MELYAINLDDHPLTANVTSSEGSFQQPDEEVAGEDSSDEDDDHEQQCEATP